MKKITWYLFFFLPNFTGAFDYVDFDFSMLSTNYQSVLHKKTYSEWFTYLKTTYQKIASQEFVRTGLRIPKIIHQIWLGGPFPDRFKNYQQTWKAHHPDWHYKLWTEEDIPFFNFRNKDIFMQATNYGEKSDIWRYEILEQFGGLYVDVDFECIKPFDELHYLFDLYVGIQPLDTTIVQLGIGIIGSCAHHPLLQACIHLLKSMRDKKQIIIRTGPLFFTSLFMALKNGSLRTIALPASYFYPRGYTQKAAVAEIWLKPESLAVHHWAGSWLKK